MFDATMPASPARTTAGTNKHLRIGWALILILFGGLLGWSVFAPFEGAILASGVLAVESNQQAVQHLEGGIVGEIFVKEGDFVENGDVLIGLNDTAVKARLQSIEARLFELIGNEARLVAERDGLPAAALAQKYQTFADRNELIEILVSQNELLVARERSRDNQVNLLNQTILQLNRRVEGLINEISANERQGALMTEEVADLEILLARGLSPKPRVLALKRDQARLDGEREALIAEVATTEIQIGEAGLELNRLTDGFREEVLTELRDVQTQIAELSEQRIAANDQLQRLQIVAPRSGRVLGVTTHTIGGVIAAGVPVMHVIPENDSLVAIVRIAPQDIDKVSPGSLATLRFSAFSANETPETKGIVEKVSADALRDETSQAQYFEVIITIPDESMTSERFLLLPGMPVDVQVRTESRTVLSYLMKPLKDAMSETFRE